MNILVLSFLWYIKWRVKAFLFHISTYEYQYYRFGARFSWLVRNLVFGWITIKTLQLIPGVITSICIYVWISGIQYPLTMFQEVLSNLLTQASKFPGATTKLSKTVCIFVTRFKIAVCSAAVGDKSLFLLRRACVNWLSSGIGLHLGKEDSHKVKSKGCLGKNIFGLKGSLPPIPRFIPRPPRIPPLAI